MHIEHLHSQTFTIDYCLLTIDYSSLITSVLPKLLPDQIQCAAGLEPLDLLVIIRMIQLDLVAGAISMTQHHGELPAR